MAALINVNGLKKSFAEKNVLNGIDLSVCKGEVVAIVGSSGTGKSTLVRCIAGLEEPSSGDIQIDGKDITSFKRSGGSIGMVFQGFNLFPHYTVKENITKPLHTIKNMDLAVADKKAELLLKKVKLSEQGNQYPLTLSGGQKQRLAIARALAMDPQIMIFDEPTSSLDPELAHEVFQTISELAKEGQTMLIVTHQINAISHFATRVCFLNQGLIEVDGPCKEVFEHPQNENLQEFLKMVEFDDV